MATTKNLPKIEAMLITAITTIASTITVTRHRRTEVIAVATTKTVRIAAATAANLLTLQAIA